MNMTQLSTRQAILSEVLAFDNEDGKFDYLIGELERIANKIPVSKKEEYYKHSESRVGTMDDGLKPKDLNNFHYFNEGWNK